MKIIIHANDCGPMADFAKLYWSAIDGADVSESGELDESSPNFTYEFIMFLLAVGRAELIIGYHVDSRIKKIGKMMKRSGLFQFKLEKQQKIEHLDLNGKIDLPTSMQDAIDKYFSYEEKVSSYQVQNQTL